MDRLIYYLQHKICYVRVANRVDRLEWGLRHSRSRDGGGVEYQVAAIINPSVWTGLVATEPQRTDGRANYKLQYCNCCTISKMTAYKIYRLYASSVFKPFLIGVVGRTGSSVLLCSALLQFELPSWTVGHVSLTISQYKCLHLLLYIDAGRTV